VDTTSIVNTVGDYSFSYCINLSLVTLPAISSIGRYSMDTCNILTEFNAPQLTDIGQGCFSGCLLLSTLDLSSVTTLNDETFRHCESLTGLDYFPNVNHFGTACFEYCTFTSISHSKLYTIGNNCFAENTNLLTVDLPRLVSMGDSTFNNCTSLVDVNIPLCTNLGTTVDYNMVFANITGNVISLAIPTSLMTCNGGNPDEDINQLQANNTVTITEITPQPSS
jgi:hypothetical protein